MKKEARTEINPIDQFGEMAQWIADNDRLVTASLSNIGPTLLDYDKETIEAVKKRCIRKLGEETGNQYFANLIATFPDRHKELFPEIFKLNE